MELGWGSRSFSPPRSSNHFWLGLVVSGVFFQVFVRVIAVEVSMCVCVSVGEWCCLDFLNPLFLLNIMIHSSPASSRKEKKYQCWENMTLQAIFALMPSASFKRSNSTKGTLQLFFFHYTAGVFKPKVLCPHPKNSFCVSGILMISYIGNGQF